MVKSSNQMVRADPRSAYTRNSQDSTDLSLGHLSHDVELLGFKLQSQIATLRPRIALSGAEGGSHVSRSDFNLYELYF